MGTATGSHWWNPARILTHVYASPTLSKRAGAMVVDLALISALQYWLSLVFGVYQPPTANGDGALLNADGFTLTVGRSTPLPLFWLGVIVIVYYTFFEALFATSPGKALFKLRVVNLDGGTPSVRAALTRNVFRLVDTLPLLYIVGGLVTQSTLHEQRVGDIIAGTTVVQRDSADGASRSGAVRLPLKALAVILTLAALIGGGIAYQYYERPQLIIQSWANANNDAGAFSTSACSLTPTWPMFGSLAGRPILEYAIGQPVWGQGEVTYPVRLLLWNPKFDSGQGPILANAVSMSILSPGPDVIDGHIRFTDFNPLNGGWWIQGGDMGHIPGC